MGSWPRLLVRLILAAAACVLVDLAFVYPFLRHLGFQFPSEIQVKEYLRDEWPNNLLSHPRYIWSYIPGSHFSLENTAEHAHFQVHINSSGFRGQEPSRQAQSECPFVALGDSFTFGWLVEEKDRWDEQLAVLIQEKYGIRAASVNLGSWMSTYDQQALMLEDNFPASARLVIHLIYPSHLQTIQRHRDKIVGGKIADCWDPLLHVKENKLYYGVGDNRLVSKTLSFPFLFAYIRYVRNMRQLNEFLVGNKEKVAAFDDKEIYEKAFQADVEEGWRQAERAIRQTATFCRLHGVPYVVVIVPGIFNFHPKSGTENRLLTKS